ncbi:hypothetical protein F5890DRAFT_1654477 [Lentinula detonsa]|uniref:Uncharacterized protein n=1 Tax=Lentinula detonsa TaxID=2804962 RepID=A0AA38PN90_9AGAR|nr:hypothetical protein F5890DRAFT_1654477 [Lentinula detonsa]
MLHKRIHNYLRNVLPHIGNAVWKRSNFHYPRQSQERPHGRGEIIDGNDDGTERLKTVQDYGIDVNFVDIDSDDEQEDGSPEALAEFNSQIAKLTAEIKCIAPNFTKAMERLNGVEQKLAETEAETEKARKDF